VNGWKDRGMNQSIGYWAARSKKGGSGNWKRKKI